MSTPIAAPCAVSGFCIVHLFRFWQIGLITFPASIHHVNRLRRSGLWYTAAMINSPHRSTIRLHFFAAVLSTLLLGACAPPPELHVARYVVQQRLGGLPAVDRSQRGAIEGRVVHDGAPVAGVSVVVAEPTGTPYSAQSDAQGRYRIEEVPAGHYVPAAVGGVYAESALVVGPGIPQYVTVRAGETVQAPPLQMQRRETAPLPPDLPGAVSLQIGASRVVTAPFPAGATAVVQSFSFDRDGVWVDSLRLYLPLERPPVDLPLLFATYPGEVDGWETVSAAFAHAGFAVVALSPAPARQLDIEAHTEDARFALALARGGHLGIALGDAPAVAVGGSFTSAILHRLLRQQGDAFAAWVTVGGISNAFSGAAAFYRGELVLPERYRFLIPALGPANLYPLGYLRYSPVYTAADLPPTLIIHTDVDRIIPIEQAHELEAALRAAAVPVDVFYYEDESHYLQIGEDLTPAGQEMYERVVAFARSHAASLAATE